MRIYQEEKKKCDFVNMRDFSGVVRYAPVPLLFNFATINVFNHLYY